MSVNFFCSLLSGYEKANFWMLLQTNEVMGGYFFPCHLKVAKNPFHKIRNPTKALIT